MMKRSALVFAVCVLFFISVSAWSANQKEVSAPASQADHSLSGKVVETMDAGGYTYVSLENHGKKTWVAMPETAVKVGQQMTCQPGAEMNDFTSKTLKRTFKSIIFSSGCR
jgi:hypothetical protein